MSLLGAAVAGHGTFLQTLAMSDGDQDFECDCEPDECDPALERDPAFLRRLRQYDRHRLRRLLEDELVSHWRRMPFDGDRMYDLAPQLTWVLGHGNPDRALEVLEGILYEFLDDERVGALAAAWGLHPRIDPNQSVDQRFSDFSSLIGNEGSDAARRRAKKGVPYLAEFLASMDLGTDDRGSLEVRITGTPDAVEARFLMMNGKSDASWFLSNLCTQLPELEVIATADDVPEVLPEWVANHELSTDKQWWKAFVLRGDVSGQPSTVGQIQLEMSWVATERPIIFVHHDLAWVSSHLVIHRSRDCQVSLSWKNDPRPWVH
jgi:hypothetical protein